MAELFDKEEKAENNWGEDCLLDGMIWWGPEGFHNQIPQCVFAAVTAEYRAKINEVLSIAIAANCLSTQWHLRGFGSRLGAAIALQIQPEIGSCVTREGCNHFLHFPTLLLSSPRQVSTAQKPWGQEEFIQIKVPIWEPSAHTPPNLWFRRSS